VIVANQMIADDDCYFLSPNSLLKKPVRDVFLLLFYCSLRVFFFADCCFAWFRNQGAENMGISSFFYVVVSYCGDVKKENKELAIVRPWKIGHLFEPKSRKQ